MPFSVFVVVLNILLLITKYKHYILFNLVGFLISIFILQKDLENNGVPFSVLLAILFICEQVKVSSCVPLDVILSFIYCFFKLIYQIK